MNPVTKTCRNCKTDFTIEPADFAFYEKMQVPAPTFCPDCRLQRRLSWRNERTLYSRDCSMCRAHIVAQYPKDTSFPVYCRTCWYSDDWDPTSCGRDFDFLRPFFEQFKELQNVVPRLNLQVDNCVNCDYANYLANSKDCYLVVAGPNNEECMYSYRLLFSKNCIDTTLINKSEYCYESIELLESSGVLFSQDIASSVNINFCYDLRGCNDCFMSSNLRNASYVFRNERLSKEEYQARMKGIDTGSYEKLFGYLREYNELKERSLRKFSAQKNSVDSTGHIITNAKNCKNCFGVADIEDCRYIFSINNARDVMDANHGSISLERVYETSTAGVNVNNVKFSLDVWPDGQFVQYSDSCRIGVSNIFGSICLRKKQYCILNKQYTKEGYQALFPKIIEHMHRTGEYGEFFPSALSPFAYNETAAQEYFPLTKNEAESRGLRWRGQGEKNYKVTLQPEDLPDHIKDVHDSITNEIIGCAHGSTGSPQAQRCNHGCSTAFRIIPKELEFYRRHNLALPRLCPNCRHHRRLVERNPPRLWHRQCMKPGCSNEFETSYAPGRSEIIYCESCYNAEVV